MGKIKELYDNLKYNEKDAVILIKKGNFYQSFKEDALILWFLFDYKIINEKVGFPQNVLEKITKELKRNKINVVVANDSNNIKKYKSIANKYNFILKKCNKLNLVDSKMLEIDSVIRNILLKDNKKYYKIMEFLNEL